MLCMGAPESILFYRSSWLISCSRDLCLKNVSFFLGTSRGVSKRIYAVSMLQLVILLPLLMRILTSRGVRIAIYLSSPLDKNPVKEGPFLSLGRKCLSAFRRHRTLNCLFVGGHQILFGIDRAENVSPWPSFKPQLNSFFLFQLHDNVFTDFACVLEYTRIPTFASYFWSCSVSILVGATNRSRIPFGMSPSEKWQHT